MNELNTLLIQILLEKIQFLIDENTVLRNQSKTGTTSDWAASITDKVQVTENFGTRFKKFQEQYQINERPSGLVGGIPCKTNFP